MKRRFQKVQKDFVLPHSLPASPKKLIHGPKISKIGCVMCRWKARNAEY